MKFPKYRVAYIEQFCPWHVQRRTFIFFWKTIGIGFSAKWSAEQEVEVLEGRQTEWGKKDVSVSV